MIEHVQWLGHASFRIRGEKVIYIDPYQLKDGVEPADIILISHEHFDHCSVDDVAKVMTDGTWIVTIRSCAGNFGENVKTVKPGDRVTVCGVDIEATPAYNIGKNFHPRSSGHVGFIVTVGGSSIYFAGDTDYIPEMRGIKADIALLPVGGKYTMNVEEALKAVRAIKPSIAVPMHWGSIVGSSGDAEKFRAGADCDVVILEAE